jgi:hypothetical protein
VTRDGFSSVQVNVAEGGLDIVGDAANEPSIAVDPTAPNRMVIGWRQFNSVASSFRQAGWGWSDDGGRSWTFPGVLEPIFRSDPVLEVDAEGRFYYYSLSNEDPEVILCELFRSDDGGRSFTGPEPAFGGDKAWVTVDRTGGPGHGLFYASWSPVSGCCGPRRVFSRSTDRGETFMSPVSLDPVPSWGTLAVGPDGELYIAGNRSLEGDLDQFVLARSLDASDPATTPTFEYFPVDLGGRQPAGEGPNPVGLVGQVWVGVDHSPGPDRGAVFVLGSVDPPGADPCDVHFVRSTDRGETWTEPVAIHADGRRVWQWFATMGIAPDGRVDVVWVESLGPSAPNVGELVYSWSEDGGQAWSQPVAISPVFDSFVGWPRQSKLGDYFHLVSDDVGADLAYAATFTGGQDVYYLRLGDRDCDRNGVGDEVDLAAGVLPDCNANAIPDPCEVAAGAVEDVDGNGVPDACQRELQPPRRSLGRFGP